MRSPAHLPSLTPLRGFAAMLVVVHHLTGWYLPAVGEAIAEHTAFVRNGFLCVDFFFLLSGFLLAHLYGEKLAGPGLRKQYPRFLGTRLARIYPLHLATLLAMLALALAQLAAQIHHQGLDSYLTGDRWVIGHGDLRHFLLNLVLLQAFLWHTPWNGPAWSISAEWFAYVLFPLLLAPARWFPRLSLVIGAPLALATLWTIEGRFGSLDLAGWPSFVRCLTECWLGILAYGQFQKRGASALARHDGTLLLALLTAVAVMHFDWSDTLAIVPLTVLIWASAANRGLVGRAINARPWVFLGEISYSIYMTHWVLMDVTKWLWKGFAGVELQTSLGLPAAIGVVVLMMVLVVAVSCLTYRYLEVPWRARLRPLPAAPP